jgi:pimeloyl-ACP methyl ester carboxylesterase
LKTLERADGSCLHIAHWSGHGPGVLLLHGAVSNGRIFASHSGHGLALFLAGHGYDIHVLDLRGRGRSTPPIDRR